MMRNLEEMYLNLDSPMFLLVKGSWAYHITYLNPNCLVYSRKFLVENALIKKY